MWKLGCFVNCGWCVGWWIFCYGNYEGFVVDLVDDLFVLFVVGWDLCLVEYDDVFVDGVGVFVGDVVGGDVDLGFFVVDW